MSTTEKIQSLGEAFETLRVLKERDSETCSLERKSCRFRAKIGSRSCSKERGKRTSEKENLYGHVFRCKANYCPYGRRDEVGCGGCGNLDRRSKREEEFDSPNRYVVISQDGIRYHNTYTKYDRIEGLGG